MKEKDYYVQQDAARESAEMDKKKEVGQETTEQTLESLRKFRSYCATFVANNMNDVPPRAASIIMELYSNLNKNISYYSAQQRTENVDSKKE